ncbi:MAG: hypothetical protein U9Q66_04195 [Patescibacteria group bacterium]|nr:hypothetical protein [Patescibacteria group bacterium]
MKDLNKSRVEGIITVSVSEDKKAQIYEYIYTYGALLNMYKNLKEEVLILTND